MIDIAPAAAERRLVTKAVAKKHEAQERDGVSVVMAASARRARRAVA